MAGVFANYSNRSSAHEWFRHDGGGAQPAAKLGDDIITTAEKQASEDLRNQFMQKQQERDAERKRDQEECKAISQRERMLLEEQNRQQSETREKQRNQLKHNLDQQLEEKRAMKAREDEEAHRYWLAQQEELNKWKRTQEDEKQKKIQHSKQLNEERLAYLAHSEQKKSAEHHRKKEYQHRMAENLASYQQQDANRKKQFSQLGAGILNDGRSAGDIPPQCSSRGSAHSPVPLDPSNSAYHLMQQIAERQKVKAQTREQEAAYAARIQKDIAEAQAEEDAKNRRIREKNMQYKAYLEKQMMEKTRQTQQRILEDTAVPPKPEHSSISGTRPW